MVEGERLLKPVGGQMAVRPEPADIVDQHIELWMGRELLHHPSDLFNEASTVQADYLTRHLLY